MRYLPASGARELGIVLEVNRCILHPMGLALEYVVNHEPVNVAAMSDEQITLLRNLVDDARKQTESVDEWTGKSVQLEPELDELAELLAEAGRYDVGEGWISGIQDHREDPEGVYFGEITDEDLQHVANGQQLLEARTPARTKALGYLVQPLRKTEAEPS
jgi:hypothetical protein